MFPPRLPPPDSTCADAGCLFSCLLLPPLFGKVAHGRRRRLLPSQGFFYRRGFFCLLLGNPKDTLLAILFFTGGSVQYVHQYWVKALAMALLLARSGKEAGAAAAGTYLYIARRGSYFYWAASRGYFCGGVAIERRLSPFIFPDHR